MATTPAPRSAAVSNARRLAAPRSLNEPVICSVSSFSTTSAPVARLMVSLRIAGRAQHFPRDARGGGAHVGQPDHGQFGAQP